MTGHDSRRHRILLVDDDPGLLRLLTLRLKSEGYEVAACESAAQAQTSVPRFRPDLVVTDLRMAEKDGIGLLRDLQRKYPALPVILMTAHGTIPDAVEATQSGAFAFLTKPVEREELLEKIERALRVSGFAASDEEWRAGIVTRNPAVEELLAQAQMAAGTDSCILISGQPGTGKRTLARAVHSASARAAGEFVLVSCSSATPEQVERVLLQEAQAGTALLDEVADLASAAQEALVRLLGAAPAERARVLGTSSRDLRTAGSKGHFRQDLFYKLSTVQVELPTLSQRRDDVPLLAAAAVEEFARESATSRVLAPEAVELLAAAEFPGNIQQLRAVIRQATLLSSSPVVSAEAVQRALGGGAARLPAFDEARDEFTKNYLVQLLQITRGNVTQAARLAGRNRTDFYKLLGRHEIAPDSFKTA
jgi:two-component system response regulator GlrR